MPLFSFFFVSVCKVFNVGIDSIERNKINMFDHAYKQTKKIYMFEHYY